MNIVTAVMTPPRLLLRLLDDIHALATVAAVLATRFDDLFALLDRADELIDMGVSLDQKAGQIIDIGDAVVNVAGAMQVHVEEVSLHLPTFARAVKLTDPVSGGMELVGRVVKRVPTPRRGPGPVQAPAIAT